MCTIFEHVQVPLDDVSLFYCVECTTQPCVIIKLGLRKAVLGSLGQKIFLNILMVLYDLIIYLEKKSVFICLIVTVFLYTVAVQV